MTECERSTRCLNFRLAHRPGCNQCGVRITMNHFHDSTAGYRICHDCFVAHRGPIEAGVFRPVSRIEGEVRACDNRLECFATEPYGRYVPKLCDGCGKYPPQHYHDIEQNIRLCLPCFGAKRVEGPD